MKILYISQYFPPEVGATQTRAYEMATNLVALGHGVTMMTEVPNHPSGVIRPGYRSRFRAVEQLDGIRVIRSWVYATPIKNFDTRMVFYLSFLVTTILNSLNLGRHDLIYATSPPLFVGLAGLIISKMRRIPFVFEVRDLWPASAVELGQLTDARHIALANGVANLCYRHARGVIAVTRGIYERLKTTDVAEQKLFLIKNGTNPQRYRYVREPGLGKRLGWKDKFVVLYAGIHGVAQGLGTVLQAASILRDTKEVCFAFIGEGPTKDALMAEAAKRNLRNVEFLPEVSVNEIAKYISLVSVCLVPLKKKEVFEGALPSKMFDCWACGKPIILSVDGEARQELEAAGGGVFVEPENASVMADAILKMYQRPSDLQEMGENGRAYIYKEGYVRSRQAQQLAQVIEQLIRH